MLTTLYLVVSTAVRDEIVFGISASPLGQLGAAMLRGEPLRHDTLGHIENLDR